MSNSFKNMFDFNFFKSKKDDGFQNGNSKKHSKRNLHAVSQYRLNAFNSSLTLMNINADTFRDGEKMMQLARDAEKNNPYVRKYLATLVSNVCGPSGFNLYARGTDYTMKKVNGEKAVEQKLDVFSNTFIQESFWDWCKKGNCDATKTLTFTNIQELKIKELYRDGEFILIIERNKKVNDWGFRLKMVNLERFDRTYNATASNGNRIVMSIEVDDNNAPIAYYIRDDTVLAIPGYFQNTNNKTYKRYDANDIIHVALKIDSEQVRGISALSAGLNTLNQITKYQEAEITNAQVSACKMGFYTTNSDGPVDPLDIADDTDEEDPGVFVESVEAGSLNILPRGYDFKETKTEYPQSYAQFMKVNLRTVATAFNISYEDLANDREGVSYSSIRAGLVADRDTYKSIQVFFIENFLEKIYIEWLKCSLINEAIVLPDNTILKLQNFNKFKKHVWRGRGFAWVDPLKDMQASKEAVKNGISSLQRECEKNGVDFQEIVEERVQEIEFLKSKGLKISEDNTIFIEENDESVEKSDDLNAKKSSN